ncbi:hypothetical protein [Kutzneria sp. 744]|nr:hypothetical protein [Kutzneria sp. 744]
MEAYTPPGRNQRFVIGHDGRTVFWHLWKDQIVSIPINPRTDS